jgi:hypothetical protein
MRSFLSLCNFVTISDKPSHLPFQMLMCRDIWRTFSSLKYCLQVLVRHGQPGKVAGQLHLLYCGAARPPLPLHLHLRASRSATVPFIPHIVMQITRTKSKLAMQIIPFSEFPLGKVLFDELQVFFLFMELC